VADRAEMRRILVAGGTGLAGSAVVRALLRSDPEAAIVATRHGDDGCILDDPRVRYVRADLTTREGCAAAAEGCGRAVMAAAVTGGAAEARTAPWRQVTSNVVMDSLLLEALHAAGTSRVVFVGTASAYQEFDGFIAEEEMDWRADPPAAHFGVGWAKRYAEKQCAFWHRATGMSFALVRAANIYGPWARFDPERSNFVAALVRKAVDRMDPFEIWGAPEVVRDVIHADDFADGVVRMLEDDRPFEVYNLGSGRKTTVGEVADLALRWAEHRPREVRYLDRAPTTVAVRALDCTKARTLLGWAPRIAPDEGIRRTVDWWTMHKDRWKR